MKRKVETNLRILAIAPTTRGLGFAVLEGQEVLADWGLKLITGDKNTRSLVKVEEMIAQFQPNIMVLEDYCAKDSRRSPRIRALGQKIMVAASNHHIRWVVFSRTQVRAVFFGDRKGTKHALAEILAKRFPEELSFRLPPKRRAWTSEYYQMNIFDAVALALVFALKRRNEK